MSLTIDILKSYKTISLAINFATEGKPTGLLGASGCGKSLTLKSIAGIETPEKGRIVLNGRVLFDSEKRINLPPRDRNIGFMFQNYALFPNMTVRQNIEIATRNKTKKKQITDKMLEWLGLTGLQDNYPGQLSGGEQQRVALARIMAYDPEVLLLDEPFSALDSYLKDQIQQELMGLLKEFRGDILMVSHSRDELYGFCENMVVISKGHVTRYGAKSDIFEKPSDITTARLTGCKNISRARKVSEHEVLALDWGITLNTEAYVEEDIRYVGIRAHNIKPAFQHQSSNTFQISLSGFSEGPFENHIFLSVERGNHMGGNSYEDCISYEEGNCKVRINSEPEDILVKGKLWWVIPKQDWKDTFKGKLPEYITLPKEHILLLRES